MPLILRSGLWFLDGNLGGRKAKEEKKEPITDVAFTPFAWSQYSWTMFSSCSCDWYALIVVPFRAFVVCARASITRTEGKRLGYRHSSDRIILSIRR